MRFKNKVALITGAAGGIGLAIARRLAGEGGFVFLADIEEEKGRAAAGELISRGFAASFVRLDVAVEQDWRDALKTVVDGAGKLDILVNNAGINIRKPIEDMDVESFDRMLAVNVKGAFLGVKHALPLLRSNGGGVVINMGSVCSLIGHKYTHEAYTTVKGALLQMTKSVAVRYAGSNIRANIVCPSTVETPLVRAMLENPERMRERMGEVPLGRLAAMEDVAQAVAYLASDDASFINGVAFPVDGGVTAW